ncbi:MAG: phosphoribosyltransferase [Patescibacteria group bacterium]|nr:MAG: phosphoribosyltransferase [Patescibacteria group bacterium]
MIYKLLNYLLFPKFCLNCKLPGAYLCKNCFNSQLQPKQQQCFFCKQHSFFGLTCFKCQKDLRPKLVYSLFRYNDLTSKVIREIKFRSAHKVLSEFLDLTKANYQKDLMQFYQLLPKNIIVDCIPLHPKRLKERGFNQAELIYDNLFKPFGLKQKQLLIRTKYSDPQSFMSSKLKRFYNVKNAFQIKEKKLPPHILLIDDIITSGHTMLSACNTLIKNGAKTVFFFALISR